MLVDMALTVSPAVELVGLATYELLAQAVDPLNKPTIPVHIPLIDIDFGDDVDQQTDDLTDGDDPPPPPPPLPTVGPSARM